ncbi:Uma2 family endonuclease [Saccharothrix sp. S26]|uniref:Uma2 family endonuclease n=1 Tax=Saccharothrix sp. S26 TaxID=2907215 RepID=UPI001F3AAFEC|nr:Uma2 family endonuclease [Saccharothrix sp. S26]MCE6993637.1 Uma2 family endonuclease [Saccharothrix sp. S26]
MIVDDGRRCELIDGMLHVSPVPGLRHQMAVSGLIVLLHADCPDALVALPGPFPVRPAESTELQPDFLVATAEDLTEESLPVAPLLAVEVLSGETELYDCTLKKAVYERIRVRSYWVVDTRVPSLTVFELDPEGHYQQVAEVQGEKPFDATLPFPVRVVPAELLGTLWEDRPE